MRTVPAAALLAIVAFVGASAAEQADPKPAPAAAPAPAAPPTIDQVRAFCASANLAVAVEGAGPFRILWVGGAKAAVPGMVDAGTKALALLEQWTGKTGEFSPDPVAEGQVCWLVALPSRDAQNRLIDGMRLSGGDLIHKVASFSLPGRVLIAGPEAVRKEIALHQSAYTAAVLAIDGWYAANKGKPATLLREGVAAEVQRQICADIRATTVSYEIGDRASEGTWPKRIKQLIAGKIPNYRAVPVRDAIDAGLEAMPISTYQEIWSVFCYLRDSTPKAKKGEDNKLMKLFRATATGASASTAVQQVYGAAEPKITQAWAAWAQQQHD